VRVLWGDSEIYGRGITSEKSRTNYKKMQACPTPFTGWFGSRGAAAAATVNGSEARAKDWKRLEEGAMMRKNWPEITSAFAIGLGVGAIVGMM
jgi:hypothetical protein